MTKTLDKEISDEEFNGVMIELTVGGIHDTLELNENMKRVPFIADEEKKEDINFLNKVCFLFEKGYGQKLSYEFEKGVCYFKIVN